MRIISPVIILLLLLLLSSFFEVTTSSSRHGVVIKSKNNRPTVESIEIFLESVVFQGNRYDASRICVVVDRPLYIKGRNNDDRLIQIERSSDIELKKYVNATCFAKDNIHHSLDLYPTPTNVTNALASLFRTFREVCPAGTQYTALIFHDDDDISLPILMKTHECYMNFDVDKLVGSNHEPMRNRSVQLLLGSSFSSIRKESHMYQYVPLKCHEEDKGKNYVTSLVELDSMASSHGLLTATQALRVGIFKIIFDPVLNTVMKPVMNAVVNSFTPELDTLFEQLEADVEAQAPGDIAEVVAAHVSATLTNVLTDGISNRIVSRVTDSLTSDLGLYLQDTVSEAVMPNLRTMLMKSLTKSVPQDLNRVLPDLLKRSLLQNVVGTLTRTLTHSLTHTISISMGGQGKHDEEFCRLCYQTGTHCEACHNSANSLYYTSYYATYYSDFYSEYYSKYYEDAIRLVDEKQHPLGAKKE